jgi:hypothetical protein
VALVAFPGMGENFFWEADMGSWLRLILSVMIIGIVAQSTSSSAQSSQPQPKA